MGSDRKVIQIDIDGVLAYFSYGFYELCNVLPPKCGYPSKWDIWDGISKKQSQDAWSKINQSCSFWRFLPLLCMPGEMRRIEQLSADNDVYFVTSRRPGINTKKQTIDWFLENGISWPTVILSSHKGEIATAIGANYSLDDKAGNAVMISYMSKKCKSFLITRPYNIFDNEVLGTKVNRVNSVSEFLDEVEKN